MDLEARHVLCLRNRRAGIFADKEKKMTENLERPKKICGSSRETLRLGCVLAKILSSACLRRG